MGIIASFVSPSFYTEALLEERVYDRVYDEVLVDPALQGTQEELLGGIQVPAEEAAEVARRVLPPGYLQAETERAIAALMGYLKKDTETLELYVDLEVPLTNAARELTVYVEEQIDAVEVAPVDPEDLGEFTQEVLLDVRAGRLPRRVPSFQQVPVEERLKAYDIALEKLRGHPQVPMEVLRSLEDPATDQAIREALAKEGTGGEEDLRDALKLASGSLVTPLVDDSLDQLHRELATPQGTLCIDLPDDADLSQCTRYDLMRAIALPAGEESELLAELDEARGSIATVDRLWPWLPLLVMALAAVAAIIISRGRPSALRGLGFSAAFTGLLTLILGQVASRVGIPALDSRIRNALDYPDFPQSVLNIALDLTFNLASDLISTMTVASIALLVIGVVVFGCSFLFGRSPRETTTANQDRPVDPDEDGTAPDRASPTSESAH